MDEFLLIACYGEFFIYSFFAQISTFVSIISSATTRFLEYPDILN